MVSERDTHTDGVESFLPGEDRKGNFTTGRTIRHSFSWWGGDHGPTGKRDNETMVGGVRTQEEGLLPTNRYVGDTYGRTEGWRKGIPEGTFRKILTVDLFSFVDP